MESFCDLRRAARRDLARALAPLPSRPADPDDRERDEPASKLFDHSDRERLASAYERVLALTDLTIQVTDSRSLRRELRRELLRWRDLVAAQYILPSPDASTHGQVFRALLQLHPDAWRQLPYVTGASAF